MFTAEKEMELSDTELRVAFDGDAVLFSDESEIIVKQQGLDSFFAHEKEFENKPLAQVRTRLVHQILCISLLSPNKTVKMKPSQICCCG